MDLPERKVQNLNASFCLIYLSPPPPLYSKNKPPHGPLNRDIRVQGEEGGREVGGRGRAGQTEAAEESHQLHLGAAQRAGAPLRRDALSGRVHEGRAEPAAGTVRGQGAGEGPPPPLPPPKPIPFPPHCCKIQTNKNRWFILFLL